MGAVFMLGGYVLIGIVVFLITKRLLKAYPPGSTNAERYRWSTYLPLFGFSLLLMAAGEPPLALIPGALLIAASIFFLLKSSIGDKTSHGTR